MAEGTKFEVVDRPTSFGNVPDALVKALADTAQSGKALRIDLGKGGNFITWQGGVRSRLKKEHNLRMRARFNKATGFVTCWAEQFAGDATDDEVDAEEVGVEDGENGVRPAHSQS